MKSFCFSRRTFLRAALGAALTSGLTGCREAPPSSQAADSSSAGSSSVEKEGPLPEDCGAFGYEGSDGRYLFLTNSSTGNSYLLHWFDYDTMQQTVVCSAPNCAHTDESCSAFFSGTADNLFRYSEGLLWIERNLSDASCTLWRMDPGNPGRTAVYTAASAFQIAAACSQGVWLLQRVTDSYDPYESHQELLYVDFNAGQARILSRFSGLMWLYGAKNGLLLMTEDGAVLNAYHPSTGTLTRTLARIDGSLLRVDDMLYLARTNGALTGWPIDGSQDAPTVQCSLQLPEGMQPRGITLNDVMGTHALLTIADEGNSVKDGPVWAADLSTGRLTALPHTYTDKGQSEPPNIQAVTPVGLFGWARTVPDTVTRVWPDGTVTTMEDRDVLWCLIDRQAAASGEWNFEEFTAVY